MGGSQPHAAAGPAQEVVRTLTIGAWPRELFRFFREPARLEWAVGDLACVQTDDAGATHWSVPCSEGYALDWEVRLTEERPRELLHWTPVAGSPTPASVEVRLRPAPATWGTAVTMRLALSLPTGSPVAAIVAATDALVGAALRRTQVLVERAGEPAASRRRPQDVHTTKES